MAWATCKSGCSEGRGWAAALVVAIATGAAATVVHAKGGAGGAATESQPPRVVVELFQVALVDAEHLRYLRQEGVLDRRGPDPVVAELLRGKAKGPAFFAGPPAIVHSTSWRFEHDGTVVLTYLAYGEAVAPEAAANPATKTIAKGDLPLLGPTDPDRPRPKTIEHGDVLAHGLRHLALLARRRGSNQALRERLGQRSLLFFDAIEPEIAGEIRGTHMDVSSSKQAR